MRGLFRVFGRFVSRHGQTGPGQAALILIAGGEFGLLMGLISQSPPVVGFSGANVGFGILVARLPWERWPSSVSLVLPTFAFVFLSVARFLDPDGALAHYGVWYVVTFAWIGLWHRPVVSMYLAPVAAAAYAAPFLPMAPAASAKELGTVVLAVPVAAALGALIARQQESRQRLQRQLEEKATLLAKANLTDDLTGIGNRRRANAVLDGLGPSDAVAILDLDHFKAVNDTHGHAEGDRILAAFAQLLEREVRERDVVARFGGEEFIVILQGPQRDLRPPIERLLERWRALGTGITVSAGVARHGAGTSPAETVARADACLYAAKEAGRDRIFVADDVAPDGPPSPATQPESVDGLRSP